MAFDGCQAAILEMVGDLLPRRRGTVVPYATLDKFKNSPLTGRKLLCHAVYKYSVDPAAVKFMLTVPRAFTGQARAQPTAGGCQCARFPEGWRRDLRRSS